MSRDPGSPECDRAGRDRLSIDQGTVGRVPTFLDRQALLMSISTAHDVKGVRLAQHRSFRRPMIGSGIERRSIPIGAVYRRNGLFAEPAMDLSPSGARSDNGAFNGNPLPPENAVGIADRKAPRLRCWMRRLETSLTAWDKHRQTRISLGCSRLRGQGDGTTKMSGPGSGDYMPMCNALSLEGPGRAP